MFSTNRAVMEFAAGSSGDVPPEAMLGEDYFQKLPSYRMFDNVEAIAIGSDDVPVLRCGRSLVKLRTGMSDSIWTILGSSTGLDGVGSIAIDHMGNIWAANSGGLMKYRAGSTGNTKPINLIYGPATHYLHLGAIALDRSGNVYLANNYPASITEYASTATGNIAPLAVIVGENTRLEMPVSIAIGP